MTKTTPVPTEGSAASDPVEQGGSVPARVAKALQVMISERDLQPGDPLPSQRELSALLHASRPSVREGLSMLETLGLIRVEKRKGLFVAAPAGRRPADFWPFDKGYDLREVYQFRVGFEREALELAFPYLGTEGRRRLRERAEALMGAALQGNAVIAAEEDTAFHDVIFDHCGNRIYRDIRRHLSKAMQDSQWVPMVIIERVRDTANEHLAIVEAIEAGDCSAACDALANHILEAARRCDIDLSVAG